MEMNDVKLAGNLTRDPQAPAGAGPVRFGLAANRRWKTDAGELREETTFVDCEAWGKVGEGVLSLPKGFPVLVEGRLKSDSWDDKATGQKRTKVLLNVHRVHWLKRREEAGTSAAFDPPAEARRPSRGRDPAPPPADDEPPF